MPRGGSKKGEHRGAAKREAKKRGLPKGQTNNPNGRPKGSTNRAVRERLALLGQELGVEKLNGMMPKDMLLAIARIFMQMALDDQAALVKATQEPLQNQHDGQEVLGPDERTLPELGAAFERHLVLAGDTAYKAASYYHPRLQALAIAGSSDMTPGDVLRGLLDEIDGEARLERQQVRQIEHEPTPEAVALKDVMEG